MNQSTLPFTKIRITKSETIPLTSIESMVMNQQPKDCKKKKTETHNQILITNIT